MAKFKLINESHADLTVENIYKILLERFGEPIAVGARDAGAREKALWDDEPKKDRNWADPNVINENETCQACGTMKTLEGEQMCQCMEPSL